MSEGTAMPQVGCPYLGWSFPASCIRDTSLQAASAQLQESPGLQWEKPPTVAASCSVPPALSSIIRGPRAGCFPQTRGSQMAVWVSNAQQAPLWWRIWEKGAVTHDPLLSSQDTPSEPHVVPSSQGWMICVTSVTTTFRSEELF